jgi:hypothetical protein
MVHVESNFCYWAFFSSDLAIALRQCEFFTQKHNGESNLPISALLSMVFRVFKLL